MNLHKSNSTRLLAVFCELREGLKNHHILEKSIKVGDFLSSPEYCLIETLNPLNNVALKYGNSSVVFEVYEVTIPVLEKISKLKGFYHLNYEQNLNNKKLINTPYGKALTYVNNLNYISNNIIEDYDYVDYYKYKNITN